MSILDALSNSIKSVVSGVEKAFTPKPIDLPPVVDHTPTANSTPITTGAFPNRVVQPAPPASIKSVISAPIANVVPKPTQNLDIKNILSKPIQTVAPSVPSVNTNTKEYLDSSGKSLDEISQNIKVSNDTLTALQKQITLKHNEVDTTNQESIDEYNKLIDDYNTQADDLQKKVTSFNTSLDDYKSKAFSFDLSGGQTLQKASSVSSSPAPKTSFLKDANQINPEDVNVRIPFTQKFISHASPFNNPMVFGGQKQNLLTTGLSMLENFPTDVVQAIPRAFVTLKEEVKNYGKDTVETKNLGRTETALYGNPEYVPVYKDIKNRIDNGDGVLSAYIGGLSNKVLDVVFGADVLARGFTTVAQALSRGGALARVEAWKTLGSPATETELKTNYRQLAQQFHPDKTGGSDEAIKTINNAHNLLDGKLPSVIDYAKNNGVKYSEWIGRQTKLTDVSGLANPDLELKDVNPNPLGAKALPGYREEPGQAPAFGMSIRRTEPVGFEEPVVDAETGQMRQAGTRPDETGQDVKGVISKPINEVIGTAKLGDETVPLKKGGSLVLPEKKSPTLFDEPKPKLPVYEGEKDLTTQTLNKLKGRASVSKTFIENLTNQPDLKQTEREIIREKLKEYPDGSQVPVAEFAGKVKAELLPLEIKPSKDMPAGFRSLRYESVSLPTETRGDVKNYNEHIFESPIKTSAGQVHFGKSSDNYFGHTRVEDMADDTTRRIIEIQSDLYQKGNLERERSAFELRKPREIEGTDNELAQLDQFGNTRVQSKGTQQKMLATRDAELSKLQQYNDPTAHFRMVREEIKKAAEDGKTKLQFPTGETAMKIEGLGGNIPGTDRWVIETDEYPRGVTEDDLKVGQALFQGNAEEAMMGNDNTWIITDVLGDGKFKAVQRGFYEKSVESMRGESGNMLANSKAALEREAETFDISGKVDTNSPIYRFYEKDLGRYLKKFGAELVTDKQGVTWYEVPINKEMAKEPVQAFKARVPFSSPLRGQKLLPLDEITKRIYADIPQSQVKLIFTDKLIDGYAVGQYRTDKWRGLNSKLKPIIELYTENGLASLTDAYHESGHYILDNFMPKDEKQKFVDMARKELGPMRDLGYKLKGYRQSADQRAEEFLMDKYAEAKAKGGEYDPKYKTFFDRMDEILKKIIDTYKKVMERVNTFFEERGGAEGGYVKNPFGETSPEEGFLASTNQKEVGKIGDADVVLGDYGKNAIERKISNGKVDRLPLSELKETLAQVTNTYKAGESSFRKDNLVNVAKMPDGEIRAVVTRLNAQEKEEVINFFKVGKPIEPFIKNLESFGIPDRNRTDIFSLERSRSYPLTYGDKSSISSKENKSIGEERLHARPIIQITPEDSQIRQRRASQELANKQYLKTSKQEAEADLPKKEVMEIRRKEQEIRTQYGPKLQDAETALGQIISEMDVAEKGSRIMVGSGPDRKFIANPSTFPKWVPEDLRSKALFDKVIARVDSLQTLHYPDRTVSLREAKLIDQIYNDLDERLNIDTSALRKGITDAYTPEGRLQAKDTETTNKLMEKTHRETAREVNAEEKEKQRVARLKKLEEESVKKLADEELYKSTLQEKINQAHAESRKLGSVWSKIQQKLKPIETLDTTTKNLTKRWLDHKWGIKELANEQYRKVYPLGPQTFKEVLDYQAGKKTPYIRDAFDSMNTEFKRRGLDFNYLEDYIPQVWSAPEGRVLSVETSYLKGKGMTDEEIKAYLSGKPLEPTQALRLKLRPNFVKERFWPDYKSGMEHGLKPKFHSPAELIAYYREQGEQSINNKNYIEALKSEAKLLSPDDAPDNWEPVTSRFSREKLYARPELARMLNGVFRDEDNLDLIPWAVKGVSKVSKFMFDMRTMAGVPNTTINSFAIGQANRLVYSALGSFVSGDLKGVASDLRASFAFIRANSNSASAKWFSDNQEYLLKMADNGIGIGRYPGSYETVSRTIGDVITSLPKNASIIEKVGIGFKNIKSGAGYLFDKYVNEKTMRSMMAQIAVQTFKDTYVQALTKGMSDNEATKFAVEVTKKLNGMLGNVGRSQGVTEGLQASFAAPYFRESVIGTLFNGGKGWSSEFNNPIYKKSRQFIIGLIISYGIYNALNKKINGNWMWQNAPGHEFDLRVPFPNGDIAYIKFGPSFFAVARNIGSAVINTATGHFDVAEQKFGSLFSTPIELATELWSNRDYFGRAIYNATDTGAEKLKKIATYAGLSVNHPFIQETYNFITGKEPLYQAITRMAELPATFGNADKEQSAKYYDAVDKKTKERADAKKPVQKIYDSNQKLKAEGKKAEADKIYRALSATDRYLYDTIKTSEKTKATNARKPAIQKIYDTNQELISEGKRQEANQIYINLSDEDRHVYDLVKKAAQLRF